MDKTNIIILTIICLVIMGFVLWQEGKRVGKQEFYEEAMISFVDDGDLDLYVPSNETTLIKYNLVDIQSCCNRCELAKLLQGGGG